MQEIEDGGTAFPAEEWIDSEDPRCVNPRRHVGMSLRDYFAAKAMQALVAGPKLDCLPGEGPHQMVCRVAYFVADAMLEARKAKP